MVVKNQIILSLLLLLAIYPHVFAQRYSYTYYTAADGLPSSEILSIARTEKGVLWIGTTHGLSRYDGSKFVNFAYSFDNFLLGAVHVLMPDSSQNIWIGASTGLYLLAKNRIVKISSHSDEPQQVYDIMPGFNGSVWLAAAPGPIKIPSAGIDLSGQVKTDITKFVLPQWKFSKKNFHAGEINQIKYAPDGTVFFSDKYNIYRYHSTRIHLFAKTEKSGDKILTLFPVNRNKLFYDGSLSELNLVENGRHSAVAINRSTQISLNDTPQSTWYAGTAGIFSLDTISGKVTQFVNTIDAGILWPSQQIKMNEGYWLASHQGLIKIKPVFFQQYTSDDYPELQEVYSFYELSNGTLLAGGNRGKVFSNPEKSFAGLWPDGKPAVSLAEIRCMHEEQGRFWIGTGYQGLVLYQKGIKTVLTKSNGLHNNSINAFFKSKLGKLYAIGDYGISEIITGKNGDISFKPFYYPAKSSLFARFYNAVETTDGTIWIGGDEGLFYLAGNALNEYRISSKKLKVVDLKKDSGGNIWIAADGEGIFQCRINTTNQLKVVKKFKQADGLNTEYFLRLLCDKKGNIWAGTPKGISCIGNKSLFGNRIFNFTNADGFLNPGYNNLNLFEDKNGRIWVSTTTGTTSFMPDSLLKESSPPQVLLTAIRLLKNSRTRLTSDSLLNLPAGISTGFSYFNSTIQFEFAAPDFASQEHMNFFYKLQGLDTAWLSSNFEHTVTYQNLAPGKYSFYVKALNTQGLWSKEPAEFAFTINPPFWLRWWFIAGCVIFLLLLVYLYVKKREAAIKLKQAQLTEIERLRTVSFQYQLEIEQVINFFANSISEQESIDEMLWDVAKNCISKLGFEDCVIYLKDENRNVLVQKAAWGPKTTSENQIVNPIELPFGKGIVGSVAVSGKTELIADTSKDNRYVVDDEIRLSELTVPMLSNEKVIGVIDSEHHQKDFYTQRHLKILTTVASLCAEKIDKMKAEQATRDKQIEVLRLSNDLSASQLTALRAQMNPHFIFNALNSIQHFILQGNTAEANRYLSSFSKLQREILNNSDQQFITLEKEKEILEIYLDLEKLRLDDNFSFEIRLNDDVDPSEIMIPPMIVQPFVENAIWHGLLPKKGIKTLVIEFHLKNDDTLFCTITDNGIGREASGLYKSSSVLNKSHKSRGLSLVYERLHILQIQFNRPFNVTIDDLTDESGNPSGTQINLELFTRL